MHEIKYNLFSLALQSSEQAKLLELKHGSYLQTLLNIVNKYYL
jgi:hypothetical protein